MKENSRDGLENARKGRVKGGVAPSGWSTCASYPALHVYLSFAHLYAPLFLSSWSGRKKGCSKVFCTDANSPNASLIKRKQTTFPYLTWLTRGGIRTGGHARLSHPIPTSSLPFPPLDKYRWGDEIHLIWVSH